MPGFDALRLRPFRHVAAAYTINELGNWIGDVALAILVFDQTRSPLATAALFLALRFAPALLGPPLTTRLEVISPRQILAVLYFSEAAIFGVLAALTHSFSLPLVLLLSAADGVLAVVARALIRSVNATILGQGPLLRQGNAIINMGVTVGGAIGPVLAGLLVAASGAGAALAVDAITFATVAIIILTAPGLRMTSDLSSGTMGRLRAGLRETWTHPTLRRLLIGTAAALLFATVVIPIEVVFAKRTLHTGDSGYGLLITAWGVGMVVGGLGFAAAGRLKLATVTSTGIFLICAGYFGLSASPDLLIACVFSAVGGMGNGLWWTAVVTALQESVSSSAQSAVMAVLESINQLMPAIGYVLGGVVTALGSPRLAYGLAGLGVGVVLLAQLVRPVSALGSHHTSPDAP
ncbi:MAG TPA: MFS transporter [Solirubrobacteraceae bacterium]|jgi:MFS family permease|nr:MFS transporter [Solirubrobacteraceae bacterium]